MGSKPRCYSFNFWPQTEEGRRQKIKTITRVLSSAVWPVFGILSEEEAHKHARVIERNCFAAADDLFMKEPRGNGRSALRLYETESCKMMWEVLSKARKTTADDEAAAVNRHLKPADTVFDISNHKVTAIGASGARSLLKPLAAPGQSYKKFCLRNRSFGLDAATFARPVLDSIKKQITDLDISGFVAGRCEDEALHVMSIFSKALQGSVLRYLNISDITLDYKGVMAFKELLESQKDLEELYVMNNGMSAEATKALSELIPSTGKLKVLHFHNNLIGDEGAMSIAEMVKRSPNLQNFKCSAARIGFDGAVALVDALGTCAHMEKLDLSDNLYGLDAAIALRKSLAKLPERTELYLSKQSLENKCPVVMVNVLKQKAPAKGDPVVAECSTVVENETEWEVIGNEEEEDNVRDDEGWVHLF